MENIRPLKKIIITGTHLTPAIELIHQLQQDLKYKWQISYIGRQFNSAINKTSSIESKIIPLLKTDFYSISSGKFDRKFFWNNFYEIPEFFKGFFQSFSLISKIKPDLIVSFGGYTSTPVIITGFLKKIPSITHEQTLTTSLATKINSLFVKKIALSFKNKNQINNLPQKKIVVTGNLLRSEIYNQNSLFFNKLKNKIKNLPIVYITAGNQGSQIINKFITKILKKNKKVFFIHQTGEIEFQKHKTISKKQSNYFASDYFNLSDIGWLLNKSEIIIGRSGANTCQEIIDLNKKSILIPLPKSQQNEQKLNALWVKNQLPSQTVIISQENLNEKSLLSAIDKLLKIKIKIKIKKNIPKINIKLLKLIHEMV